MWCQQLSVLGDDWMAVGWLIHPERLTEKIGDLVEYNTSGTPEFLQEAGIVAVRDGEETVAAMVERC